MQQAPLVNDEPTNLAVIHPLPQKPDSALRRSPEIHLLAAALAKAQGSYHHPVKNRTVKMKLNSGTIEYKYADLVSTINCCKDGLSSNGLSIVQSASTKGKTVVVITLLLHSSGQYIEDTLILEANDQKPQSIGSAITYARRYAYQAMAGVSSEEDDDGTLAHGRADGAEIQEKPGQSSYQPVYVGSDDQRIALKKLFDKWEIDDANVMKELSKALQGSPMNSLERELERILTSEG